jgi:acetolactate synthase regulatory subunit
MHRFRIDAILDPHSLPRVAGFFAQRSIMPSAMQMQIEQGRMRIEITVDGLAAGQAATIAAKLHEAVTVIGAELYDMAA